MSDTFHSWKPQKTKTLGQRPLELNTEKFMEQAPKQAESFVPPLGDPAPEPFGPDDVQTPTDQTGETITMSNNSIVQTQAMLPVSFSALQFPDKIGMSVMGAPVQNVELKNLPTDALDSIVKKFLDDIYKASDKTNPWVTSTTQAALNKQQSVAPRPATPAPPPPPAAPAPATVQNNGPATTPAG